LGPETFLRVVVLPVGLPPRLGSGLEGEEDFFFTELLDVADRRVFLAFEQPPPAVKRRLATIAIRRMRRMTNFRSRNDAEHAARSRPSK
jgi:hypothetical protein